jgi:hypothetical protein
MEDLENETRSFVQKWTFSSPGDHEGNGRAERMIRTVKEALRSLPYAFQDTFDTFRLSAARCASVINERPIFIDKRPEGWKVITPSHFLKEKLGAKFSTITLDGNFDEKLREVDRFVSFFRETWSLVYRHKVRSFPKWATAHTNLKVGQYVVIIHENEKRDKWPLAIITDVKIDEDGLVRNVEVKECEGNPQKKWRHTRYLVPVQFFEEVPL